MKLLFTICGRAGSKGIKNKNIRDFLGYKLPLYTLSAIDLYIKRHPEMECDVVANSDSLQLLDILCGTDYILNQRRKTDSKLKVHRIERKNELAGDRVAKIDVVCDCLCQMQDRLNKKYDMVVDLDITSPLRTVSNIEQLIQKKCESGCDIVYSVVESRRNPYFNMVMKSEKGYVKVCPSDFVTRQQAPVIYDMNASMYAYEPSFLSSGKGVLEGYGEIIVMYDTGILDLDHENDFELMEVIAGWLFENKDEFREIKNNLKVVLD